jgi:branched-chain amino acid transport system substrate-binding protein
MLAIKRPDIQIVGEDLHPISKVKDFSPYVAKIRASGADSVITGNWGADLTLLVRAAKESGLNLDWYTYYAGSFGFPAAIGDAGIGRVKIIVEWTPNVPNAKMDAFYNAFKKKFPKPEDEFYYYRMKVMAGMLANAINQTKSTDALKLATALEGMVYKGDLGDVAMRKEDHQSQQVIYVGTFDKLGSSGVKYDLEGSGFGFGRMQSISAKDAMLPTSCKMQRPAA